MTVSAKLPENDKVLAVVFGLPGPCTGKTAEALQSIARIARRECVTAEVNSIDDWQAACEMDESVIVLSPFPSLEVSAHISSIGIPALVVLNSPLDAVALLVALEHSDTSAVRAVSASVSCLSEKLFQDRISIRTSNAENLDAFVTRLAAGLASDVSAFDLNRLESLITELSTLNDALDRKLPLALTGNLSSLASAVLPTADHDPDLDEGVKIDWPGSLFLLGDSPDTPMHGSVDLSGPARCVLYGPYMHLPAGAWTASVAVGLADCLGERSFTLEVVCREVIAKGRFHCRGSGTFNTRLDFQHRHPDVPIELRLFLDAGEIYGSVTKFDVSLQSSAVKESDLAITLPMDLAG
ncbi:MAG: hypothetical protein ABW175_12510 [Bradyrhizobium sp.]